MKNLNIRVYDNGGKTLDRYTVIYLDQPEPNSYEQNHFDSRSMCANPCSPQGIGCWGTAKPGRHLGIRITFDQLPDNCKKLVLDDLNMVA